MQAKTWEWRIFDIRSEKLAENVFLCEHSAKVKSLAFWCKNAKRYFFALRGRFIFYERL